LLHFTSRDEWERGLAAGRYEPAAMSSEGFVHLSFGHQLARVATELARGQTDLLLLVVDPAGLEASIRVEDGFPHLYRPIPVDNVRLVADFRPDSDGSFALPDTARLAELELTALPSTEAVLDRCRLNMAGFSGPWWIAGGWACDAAAGTVSRPHLDIDVAVLRPDVPGLGQFVDSWDVRLARSGTLAEWDGRQLAEEDHQLWLRPDDGERPERWQDFAADPGFFEVLVERFDTVEKRWEFRRNIAVNDVLNRLGTAGGFLSPEVALLYKAAAAHGKDDATRRKAQADFDHAVGHLVGDQRVWLRNAIQRAHGEHPWLSQLGD
jgi:uncharacterized protein (DUF952 family)